MKKAKSRKAAPRRARKAAPAKAAVRVARRPAARRSSRAAAAAPAQKMHAVVVSGLKHWVSTLDDAERDEPIVAAAAPAGEKGVTITPRTLVDHVEKRTAIGKKYNVDSIQRLAVNQVMKTFSGS